VGSRGPVAKRDATRAGHRASHERADTVAVPYVVEPPALDESYNYHPRARRFYDQLARSGQSQHFEPSDWELAALRCRLASHLETKLDDGDAPSASLIDQVSKIDARLGVTENDRRRMRVEVDRPRRESGAGSGPIAGNVADRIAQLRAVGSNG
jgi:hypothetical protein